MKFLHNQLKKLENIIHVQIGSCKSVGVRNRPERDQCSHYFVSDFKSQDGVYRLVFCYKLIENNSNLHWQQKWARFFLYLRFLSQIAFLSVIISLSDLFPFK